MTNKKKSFKSHSFQITNCLNFITKENKNIYEIFKKKLQQKVPKLSRDGWNENQVMLFGKIKLIYFSHILSALANSSNFLFIEI